MNSLEEIAERVRVCVDCPLSQTRTHAVPGEGPSTARIMFIGEAPGYHEDNQGRPFIGPAGRFLDELLHSIGLRREEVFIANMIKCRPPQNRDPLPAEVATCSKYLDRQIELLNPDLIVTLGRYSMSKFFPKESISRTRGKVRTKEGLRILPLYHPAAALHQRNLNTVIREDFQAIPRALQQAREADEDPQGTNPATPSPRQLSMF